MTRFLLCSFALVLLYPSGIDMYLVGLPRIAQDLGASEAQLHIAFSVYLAGMASAMLFAGRIADRSGRKPVAIVGAAIFVIASLLCAQAHTSSHFLTGRFIQGIGAGCCYVVAFATLRDTMDDRRRAKVLSLLNGITCIIPVLAPVLGHLIMLKYPWQSLFYTMIGMGVTVGLLAVFILRETRPTAPAQTAMPLFPQPHSHHHPQRDGDPHLRERLAGTDDGGDGVRSRHLFHDDGADGDGQHGGLLLDAVRPVAV